uniref:C-JID domain-containing protein n=1 Tax=Brassica oleracea var. oleracea TaxID=109376 RepID=A0A0D3D953_BRAOL
MPNLPYFKIFDSGCPLQCDPVDCQVNLPNGLEFPLKEIRYLHWLKFPREELPPDFNPMNLIDLRLPYSKIKRVWRETKDTPNLKWVDLTHSTNLNDISALSNAISLRRLSLEGCTKLDKLPEGIENMKSLAFLNLRGCTRLLSLPDINNLISLKTLILSDCKMFNEFQVISDNLEYLHLDGTAIKGLPPSIQNLGKLIVLNLKDCNELESLPDCLDKLKALQELILSGCSRLRRNDKIRSLQSSISQLYHLKWIDSTYCNNLTSLSTLPPNLQCLDAHDCTSLRTVASPLASLLPSTEQVPSSFIFTNCEKLEHVAMNEIMCYAHNKSRLISDALNRQNKRLALEALVGTCFPGIEVPAWFNHKASGAVIKPELPRHWSESGFSNCDVGGLSEAGIEQCTVKSTHVFIGFTSWLNINKSREVGLKEGCIPAKASIEFKVTDGTCEAANCEVLKCGFSFVCESDNGSWNANADANPMIYESNNGALEANAEATPVIVETNTGSSDANVVANPVVEGEIQGGGRFLGLLRRRAWFLNL